MIFQSFKKNMVACFYISFNTWFLVASPLLGQSGRNEPLPPPPSGSRPIAGTRGECDRPETYADLPDFTILEPNNRAEGLTVREFPTFLVYLPFELDENSRGKFVLETLDGTQIYSQEFLDASSNQILSITIPSVPDKALVIGQTYRVEFRVDCGEPGSSTPLAVRSRVQRVEGNSSETFWYDELASVYVADSTAALERLLESQENLQGIADALTVNP